MVSLGDTGVAVGTEGSRPRQLASRVSTDGATWVDGGAAPPEGEWLELAAMAAGPDRIVVVGSERPSWDSPVDTDFGVAWVSADGFAWERAELPGNPEGRAPIPSAVAWDGNRFLAFATELGLATDTIWTSADGLTWDRLDATTYPGFRANDAVRWSDRLVVIGNGVAFSPPLD